MTDEPLWQVLYRSPQDVTRRAPPCRELPEAQELADGLLEKFPEMEARVELTWTECFAGGD